MELLGIENAPPVISITEMQARSVFQEPNPSLRERVVRMTPREEDVWRSIVRVFDQASMPIDRAVLMEADLNRGGRTSPEDQMTLTFRVNR